MNEAIDSGMHAGPGAEKVPPQSDLAFQSESIKFSHSKIELVRNKFVYEKLDYSSILEITLSDGYLLKNRWIIRALSFVGLYFSIKILYFFLVPGGGLANGSWALWFNKGSLVSVWGPTLIIIGASLALYQSFVRSTILTIKTNNAAHVVRINYLEEERTFSELQHFLTSKGLRVIDQRKVKL